MDSHVIGYGSLSSIDRILWKELTWPDTSVHHVEVRAHSLLESFVVVASLFPCGLDPFYPFEVSTS
jgi:hypothetical protein